MSNLFIRLAQFTYILWPLFLITTIAYSLSGNSGKGWLRQLARRVRRNLLWTWLGLFAVWGITLFAGDVTPTLFPEPWNSLVFFCGLALLLALEARRLRIFPARIHARMSLHSAQAVSDLRAMDPGHFEELVAETFRGLGYHARRSGQSGDHGIDVELITPQGERWIVQCKRYRDPVGESVVRELYGTLISEKAARALLVTSAHITPPAILWARGKPIDLINGQRLARLVAQSRRRVAGSPFDRFTTWLEGVIRLLTTPPALRGGAEPAGAAIQHALPASPPVCPNCGLLMIEHPLRPNRGLFRCPNYPSCRVVLEN